MNISYQSGIWLGKKYRDIDTNFEGVANRITFSRNTVGARVELRALHSGQPVEHWFDAINLRLMDGEPVGFTVTEEMIRDQQVNRDRV